MMSRKFYHNGRGPLIEFMAKERAYKGRIANYWSDGLQVVIHHAPAFAAGVRLGRLKIAKNSKELTLCGLKVVKVQPRKGYYQIDLQAVDPSSLGDLQQLMARIEGTDPSESDNLFDPSKIPYFNRKHHYSDAAVASRLDWGRKASKARLEFLPQNLFKHESLAGNIENYIGAVQIPVGLVGPILVKGVYTQGYIPVPVATSEGALVSSMSRGAQVCNLAGGIHVYVSRQRMLRAPVFFCQDMDGAINLEHWIVEHQDEIRTKAENVSSVAQLQQIVPFVFDNTVHLQFYYSTGDAAGQNMSSACTWMACRWIRQQIRRDPAIGYSNHMIEGNMSGDKKANYQNFIHGRGIAVTATCRIPGALLKRRLRVTPAQFVRGWHAGEVGSLQVGMIGSNINFANAVAGIFTATGQDIACVHESAAGYFKARQESEDLICSAYLPSLVIGTVGGGTQLPTQSECLELMGCLGSGHVFRLAEVIAATCVALDLSTGAAIVANEFVHSHEQLGRNRPDNRLAWSEINKDFFSAMLFDRDLYVVSAERKQTICGGIISELIRKNSKDPRGLHRFELSINGRKGAQDLSAVIKLKPTDRELLEVGAKVARLTGEDTLSGLYEAHSHIFNLDGSNLREIGIYSSAHEDLRKHMPQVFGTCCDHERRIYAVLMEDLSSYSHLDTVDDPSAWRPEHIRSVLKSLAAIHAIYWNRIRDIEPEMHLTVLDAEAMEKASDLLRELTAFNAFRYSELIPSGLNSIYKDILDDLVPAIKAMQQFPVTLTHNDFNPRNICFRPEQDGLRPVIYDWELAFIQNPQHDLIEFLVFLFDPETSMEEYDRYIDIYLGYLEENIGALINRNEFMSVLHLNAVHLAIVRFNLYLLGHNLLNFSFMDRVYRNLGCYIESVFRRPNRLFFSSS